MERDANGKFVKGHKGHDSWSGRKMSRRTRRKMRAAKLKRPTRFWKGKERVHMLMEQHPMWKGGRILDKEGYVLVRVDKKYKPEHRIVMEAHLGRVLLSTEVVHHIDRNKSNNDLSNLEVHDRSSHMFLHVSDRKRGAKGTFLC